MITTPNKKLAVSDMAENLIGSEIIKLAGEVNELIRQGQRIFNFTIGDFDPQVFPIPDAFLEEIVKAYREGQTNYPPANGMPELRKTVSSFLEKYLSLSYSADDILIAGGARPLIYSLYQTILDRNDQVVFPIPSWNNNHYCHLSGARPKVIVTRPENNFMPTASELKDSLKDARLLSLCSPLNPTGTVFSRQNLQDICELVLEENHRRREGEKPLYVLYDQIYWVLTFGDTRHENPVSILPEMRDYTVFIDGLSKSFAATGVRVGWAFGPQKIMDKMKTILGHVGAWAPRAEQVASARFMQNDDAVESYLSSFKEEIDYRLQGFYKGFERLKEKGYPVDVVAPQAAIYLTVKIDLRGYKKPDGSVIKDMKEVGSYILNEAHLATVPFSAFGSPSDSPWYRLSVGTCRKEEIPLALDMLEKAFEKLSR